MSASHGLERRRRLFGTDGVRGRANRPPMDPGTVFSLCRAAAEVLSRESGGGRRCVVVGLDTRISGPMLEAAVVSAFSSAGYEVLRCGVVPTPAVSFLVNVFEGSCGVMVSASHNPYYDNGVKFFASNGEKLSQAVERRIEELFWKNAEVPPASSSAGAGDDAAVGRVIDVSREAVERYLAHLRGSAAELELSGRKIVVDCANGAASALMPRLLEELGADVVAIHSSPDGMNINAGCGALHPDVVAAAVVQEGAWVGVCHDGDADRVLLSDERGEVVDGDHVLAMCARALKAEERLEGDVVVSTVMANLGLEMALKKLGVELIRTPVGDRYVKEAMNERGAVLGGEQSGHVIFSEYAATGDGLITALQVLRLLEREGAPLSELAGIVEKCPQVLVNVRVESKPPFDELEPVREAVEAGRERLGEEGRIVLRYSGTEPLARVMVEGRDRELIESVAESVARALRSCVGCGEDIRGC